MNLKIRQPSPGTVTEPSEGNDCNRITNILVIENSRQFEPNEASIICGKGNATYHRENYPGIRNQYSFSLN